VTTVSQTVSRNQIHTNYSVEPQVSTLVRVRAPDYRIANRRVLGYATYLTYTRIELAAAQMQWSQLRIKLAHGASSVAEQRGRHGLMPSARGTLTSVTRLGRHLELRSDYHSVDRPGPLLTGERSTVLRENTLLLCRKSCVGRRYCGAAVVEAEILKIVVVCFRARAVGRGFTDADYFRSG
jgi:hypothetical protein